LASSLPASAQEGDIIELVIGLLNDSDIDMRSLALEQVRTEVKGEAATLKFAEQLPELSADAQAGLIRALADRADVAAKPAVTEMLGSNDETVRIAAIRALSALGDASDCAPLISMLRGSSAEQTAAETSLIQIQGEGVPDAITTKMANSAPSIQTRLIDILASRRAFEAIPKLLEVAVGDSGNTRMAAMRALGNLASAEHIPTMVRAVLKADRGSERSNAERNVVFVCNRVDRSEERRVGKECRSRWSPYH
jgi:HEAT repeat protein